MENLLHVAATIFTLEAYFSLRNVILAAIIGCAFAFLDGRGWSVKSFVTGFIAVFALGPLLDYALLRPFGI